MPNDIIISFISPFIFCQNIAPDESDDEWDDAIRRDFGVRGRPFVAEREVQMDEDVNIIEAVQHAFHL